VESSSQDETGETIETEEVLYWAGGASPTTIMACSPVANTPALGEALGLSPNAAAEYPTTCYLHTVE
jgi:hypothetical protein